MIDPPKTYTPKTDTPKTYTPKTARKRVERRLTIEGKLAIFDHLQSLLYKSDPLLFLAIHNYLTCIIKNLKPGLSRDTLEVIDFAIKTYCGCNDGISTFIVNALKTARGKLEDELKGEGTQAIVRKILDDNSRPK